MTCTLTIQSTTAITTALPDNLLMPAYLKIASALVCALLAVIAGAFVSTGLAATGPPAFVQVPADRVVYEGERVTFQVATDGTSPTAFQWFQNDQPVPGATGTNFVLPQVGSGDDGAVFSVSASNVLGQFTSSNALLTMKA